MNAFRICLVGMFMLMSIIVKAVELRPQGPHASVRYLLQVANGLTVTPMAGEEIVQRTVSRDEASMYIHGVIDTGENRQWCIYLSNLPPHEVIDEVLKGLRALPPSAKDRNSAAAIGDFLRNRFPCRE